MNNRFNIVIRSTHYNNGQNKYATVINEEHVTHFAKAVNSNIDSVLVNGIRLQTKAPDYVKIFKIKPEWSDKTDNEVKNLLRDDAVKYFNGKLNIRILKKHGEDVTAQYVKTGITEVNDKQWTIIHPKVVEIAKEKFEDGYFSDAVLSVYKEINDLVKKEYQKAIGKEEDGTSLMQKAFAHQNPVFKLTDLSTESRRNIQQGYMNFFAGAMMGIRNPMAHANIEIVEIDAWEKIVFASHLMKMWDNRV